MVLKRIYQGFLFCTIAVFTSCASQSSLGGGEKDVTPPKLVKCIPENQSLNFTGKQIELTFDEFINLKSVQQKLIISPPTTTKPDVISKNRSVIVNFNEDLLPNTTYNFNFSDAIADLNEGNSINDFHFCLSTGSALDSLKISGNVKDAFSHKPETGFFVLLYNENQDSLPLKSNPFYLSKTNGNGDFYIDNIREGRYKIFALNDVNSNLIFDLPTEKIAFLDSLFVPSAKTIIKSDTLKKGFVLNQDTLKKDSIVNHPMVEFKPNNIVLRTFEEDRQKQFIKSTTRTTKNKCVLVFNRKGINVPSVNGVTVKHFLVEQFKNNDSLILWLTDSIEYANDSVRFQITYYKKDSTNKIFTVTDPVVFVYNETDKKNSTVSKISTTINVQQDQQWISNNDIRFQFSAPVSLFTPDSIVLEEGRDSVFHRIKPKIVPSELSPCVYFLKYPWKDEMRYRLRVDKGKIKDIYGNPCDSLLRAFKTYPVDYYGIATFIFEGPDSTFLFQLINSNGNVVAEWSDQLPLTKRMENLLSGKYRLRAFVDDNKNGKWDTGIYLKHQQPEKMFLCPDEINLRSNWEIEVKWKVKDIE